MTTCTRVSLAAIRLIISLAASRTGVRGELPRKIGWFDITAGFIHAFIKSWMVIIPPKGIVEPGEGLWLLKALYGTRDASRLWQDHYSKIICDNGWLRGKIFPATFYHQLHDMSLACHGDDFICEGTDSGIDELETVMRNRFEAKAEGCIGPNSDKKGTLLKRDIESSGATI
jgi:hypothetical protein